MSAKPRYPGITPTKEKGVTECNELRDAMILTKFTTTPRWPAGDLRKPFSRAAGAKQK